MVQIDNESNESSKKVNDHFDKENQQISSNSATNGFIHSATNNTITTNPNATPIANSTSSSNSNQDNNQPKTVFTTKPSSMSNPNRVSRNFFKLAFINQIKTKLNHLNSSPSLNKK